MRILLILRFNMGEKGNLFIFFSPKASGLFSKEKKVSIFQWILCSSGKSFIRYNFLLSNVVF